MSAAAIFGQLLAGWLIADFLGGLFHWWEDRVARQDMPVIGPWLIQPNRLHHIDPLAFTQGNLLDRSLAAAVTATVIAGVWALLLGPSLTLASAWLGGVVMTEVHRLAHQPSLAGSALRVMQEMGLIQSPKHHAGHHRPPSDRRYCVLTDWLNPSLDALRVWDRLEAGLAKIGLQPSKGFR